MTFEGEVFLRPRDWGIVRDTASPSDTASGVATNVIVDCNAARLLLQCGLVSESWCVRFSYVERVNC